MRCWLYTRSGGIASTPFYLNTPDGIEKFKRVFWGYLGMDERDMGLLTWDAPGKLTIGGTTLLLDTEKPLFRTSAIATRGTACWIARVASDITTGDIDTPFPWVVKDSWRYPQRQNEGVLLQACRALGVKGIAEYLAHEEGGELETVHDILGLCNNSSLQLLKKLNEEGDMSEQSEARQSGANQSEANQSEAKKRKSDLTSEQSSKRVKTGSGALASGSNLSRDSIVVPDRIHTRLVIARGRRIDEFDRTRPLELLECMSDAVHGHRSLLTVGRILHRDISINNIMIPLTSRRDDFRGFLIDLDLAVSLDEKGRPCGAPERTGTHEFMSIEALEFKKGFVHTFFDDLQSFMFVFLWLCCEGKGEEIKLWGRDARISSGIKGFQMTDKSSFETLLEGFKQLSDPEPFKQVARNLREVLWPNWSRISREVLEARRDQLYKDVIKTFDDAVKGWVEPRQ